MHRLTRLGFVNAYLVEDDDGLTLVDALLPGSQRMILRAAERLGAPIRRIALTHGHTDHVGALDALADALPEVEVVISARDARLLAGDKTVDPDEPQGKIRGGVSKNRTTPTRTVAAGDRVGSLEVVAASGHTPGHLAFLDTRDGTLFCGDAYTTLGGVRTSAGPQLPFPLAGMATWDRATERATARALRDLGPARLAPGHGRVVEDPRAAMDAAIARVDG